MSDRVIHHLTIQPISNELPNTDDDRPPVPPQYPDYSPCINQILSLLPPVLNRGLYRQVMAVVADEICRAKEAILGVEGAMDPAKAPSVLLGPLAAMITPAPIPNFLPENKLRVFIEYLMEATRMRGTEYSIRLLLRGIFGDRASFSLSWNRMFALGVWAQGDTDFRVGTIYKPEGESAILFDPRIDLKTLFISVTPDPDDSHETVEMKKAYCLEALHFLLPTHHVANIIIDDQSSY